MKNIGGLLIDLDGTLFHGGQMIPGADKLIEGLRTAGIPFLFVTNNSSRTAAGVAAHLRGMGIAAKPEEVCTSSLAAARYIAGELPEARVAILGEEGLIDACAAAGLKIVEDDPQYVVQGIYRAFTYDSLARASRWIMGGAKFVLTNPDLMLPSDDGVMPGAGTIGAAIEAASGVAPVVIGKPEAHLITFAASILGIKPEEAVVVGDNMRTDISAGVNAGCRTVLVLTGLTTAENLEHYKTVTGVTPDEICSDLAELRAMLGV
ncbi:MULTISPECIES: HAD-IIA family hydrolase [unclassified Paenibacillus]|uniref:HAD-IIA family hydrolase n=1 Tax=unclassified Paenibacillus TaxID=185978 RepID=UPI0024064629|nr:MULTISPECIES: HAD-IIA family hydrolase [unclassified Paenibacillus]MDF9841076.1 4-nitrophenyl phosphatase [Paenibacillus sp. PastF-2]MDF9847752.1 4-nitrophenyl phosphatase [Paenibacillus sp. PastM-2]MDF9854321.1 4-nitrophenyl phosphatase [Paenibacillus sp. PastF-1]MDH6479508.1 4-nitrophenyl phosphatase [Paenibacillus sp. PastH-2]MDH6505174.1 4-nitrophenyl phosphatase [Paenibacillus sp. PastM-3]